MIRDVASSVHQRLLNLARLEKRPFNELLQHFALERFLYRLGVSPYRDRLVLKGALMFTVWEALFPRPTRDIDLLGHLDNAVEHIMVVVREICEQPVIDDGLRFAAETVVGERIIEIADYEGVRVHFTAYLGSTRIPMQIDIGFGDRVIPAPLPIQLPALLDFPPVMIQGYTRESAIAEKLQSMVRLGEMNSRMKDFFDIWLLTNRSEFSGVVLGSAICETFQRRHTLLVADPVAFQETFAQNPDKQVQWIAFLHRSHLRQEIAVPRMFSTVVAQIAAFLRPLLEALVVEGVFDWVWYPGGPWTKGD